MKRSKRGFTLVEIAVSMLVLAMVASGIFAVILSSRTTQVSSDQRQLAFVYAQKLRDELRRYVGDYTAGDYPDHVCKMMCNSTCNSGCTAKVSGDACANAFTAGCTHNATSLLPAWFSSATGPFYGVMCYTVSDAAMNGRTLKQVNITVKWNVGPPVPACP